MELSYSTTAGAADTSRGGRDYITSDEAADLCRRPVSTLAYWRHRGEGPRFAKIGRRVMYRREDVVSWLDAQFADGRRASA